MPEEKLGSSPESALQNAAISVIVNLVGQGVTEMRIHFGPGYRIYFTRVGNVVYVLLCGGTKRSQRRDIAKAQEMVRTLKEG